MSVAWTLPRLRLGHSSPGLMEEEPLQAQWMERPGELGGRHWGAPTAAAPGPLGPSARHWPLLPSAVFCHLWTKCFLSAHPLPPTPAHASGPGSKLRAAIAWVMA